jgi:hypothetical protein
MLAGATNYDEFLLSLKTMEIPFNASVKDLRSQVKKQLIYRCLIHNAHLSPDYTSENKRLFTL